MEEEGLQDRTGREMIVCCKPRISLVDVFFCIDELPLFKIQLKLSE